MPQARVHHAPVGRNSNLPVFLGSLEVAHNRRQPVSGLAPANSTRTVHCSTGVVGSGSCGESHSTPRRSAFASSPASQSECHALSCEVCARAALVVRAVIWAPTIMAPPASRTRPSRRPVTVWAAAGSERRTARSSKRDECMEPALLQYTRKAARKVLCFTVKRIYRNDSQQAIE